MLLTQGVPYIDREQLGLSYISCPSLLRFRGPRHDNINLYISLYIVDHYLNIGLLELWSIVCQIHIEKESDVWFGRYSQWLAQLADLPTRPFGLVFSLHSMQKSWGLLMTWPTNYNITNYDMTNQLWHGHWSTNYDMTNQTLHNSLVHYRKIRKWGLYCHIIKYFPRCWITTGWKINTTCKNNLPQHFTNIDQ